MANILPGTGINSIMPTTTPGSVGALANGNLNVNNPPVSKTGIPAGSNQVPGTAGNALPPSTTASTTVISNGNKINQGADIQSTTEKLANSAGITSDNNGNQNYANGTAVQPRPVQTFADGSTYDPNTRTTTPPTTPQTPSTAPSTENNSTTQSGQANAGSPTTPSNQNPNGGYYGDVYYPPGSTPPTDNNGNPINLTATSPTDDYIINSINTAKAQSDAMTQSILDQITSNYASLISNQEQINSGQQARVNNGLMMGGATGQGSSMQYASVSSNGILQAQMSYGLSQIADLNNKEQTDMATARKAGMDEDLKLMDSLNTEISKIRDDKVAAAKSLNDIIAAQNQKLNDAKIQNAKDTAVANLYASGITDPKQILNELTKQGLIMTAAEVNASINNINPDKATINNVLLEAAKAGASPQVMAAIQGSNDAASALAAAAPALGAKALSDLKQQAFDNNIKLQTLMIQQTTANLTNAKTRLEIQQLQDSQSPAAILNFAQMYQSSGVLPASAPKGSEAAIAAIAQNLPKPVGTVYDTETGVGATKLTPEQEQNVSALYNIVNNVLPHVAQSFGQSTTGLNIANPDEQQKTANYTQLAENLKSALDAMGTTGILKGGVSSLEKLIPNVGANWFEKLFSSGQINTASGKAALANLTNTLKDQLDSYLSTNNLSIAGYSDSKDTGSSNKFDGNTNGQ